MSNFITNELKDNKEVKERLEQLRRDFSEAKSTDQILEKLNSYPEDYSIDYKYKIKYLLYLCSLLTLGLIWVAYKTSAHISLYLVVIVIAAGFLISAIFYAKKGEERSNILESFVSKFEEMRFNFKYFGDQKINSFKDLKEQYSTIFQNGNHKNSLPIYATGLRNINEEDMAYSLFKYEYCKRTTGTERIKNKTVKFNIYKNYEQWGIFISDVNSPSFAVATYDKNIYPVPWTTSHHEFNEKYCVSAENEIEIAKIMQPANVLMFESFMESIPTGVYKLSSYKDPKSGNVYEHYKGSGKCEVISSAKQGSVCVKMNMDVFERQTAEHTGLKTPKELAKFLDSINLVNFDKIFELITPMIKKVKK